jgi:hypothetical protein
MALKGKPILISNTATTVYTCPAGVEASVHGLLFSNNTGGGLTVDVSVFNQADNTTVVVATGLEVPANQFITWTKPINLAAGDSVIAEANATPGIVSLFSVFEGSASPVAIGFTGRGEWSNTSTYSVNDIVSVTSSGTFLALQNSTNEDPTTETAFWMFLEGISASALPSQTGQSGNFLTTDGTDASWATIPPPPDAPDIEVFTSPGTWTKPATVRRIKVTVVGAGGGSTGVYAGSGGGGAAIKYIPAPTIPGPVSVTVGAGNSGNTGSSSSFGPFASATGGATGSDGGVGSGGDLNINGSGGNSSPGGSGGGSSIFAGAGTLGANGTNFGGGSGSKPGSPTAPHRIGGPGVVIVEEFY